MASTLPADVTRLLRSLDLGDEQASARLFEAVYDQLRGLAALQVRGGTPTLQPTALVHEAWLKLDGKLAGLRDRKHFLALAGLAMRQILASYARAARALRRDGGPRASITLDLPERDERTDPLDLVMLDDALTRLATLKERHARVVELRYLASLTIRETAEALGVATSTVEADWAMAQAWLRREFQRG